MVDGGVVGFHVGAQHEAIGGGAPIPMSARIDPPELTSAPGSVADIIERAAPVQSVAIDPKRTPVAIRHRGAQGGGLLIYAKLAIRLGRTSDTVSGGLTGALAGVRTTLSRLYMMTLSSLHLTPRNVAAVIVIATSALTIANTSVARNVRQAQSDDLDCAQPQNQSACQKAWDATPKKQQDCYMSCEGTATDNCGRAFGLDFARCFQRAYEKCEAGCKRVK